MKSEREDSSSQSNWHVSTLQLLVVHKCSVEFSLNLVFNWAGCFNVFIRTEKLFGKYIMKTSLICKCLMQLTLIYNTFAYLRKIFNQIFSVNGILLPFFIHLRDGIFKPQYQKKCGQEFKDIRSCLDFSLLKKDNKMYRVVVKYVKDQRNNDEFAVNPDWCGLVWASSHLLVEKVNFPDLQEDSLIKANLTCILAKGSWDLQFSSWLLYEGGTQQQNLALFLYLSKILLRFPYCNIIWSLILVHQGKNVESIMTFIYLFCY